MKIAIAGTGYVGLANAILLAQHNEVTAVDLVQAKVDQINAKKSPLADPEIEDYLAHKPLHLTATTDGDAAYQDADFVVVSTPTNYDPVKNYFDTSSVESAVRQVMAVNPNAVIVIKSTVPVGYTLSLRDKLSCKRLSSWGLRRGTGTWPGRRRPSPICSPRGRRKRTCPSCSSTPPRPRR